MNEPKPKPLITQALDELEQRLQLITVTNGYHTDAGLCVVRGRMQFNAIINPDTRRTYDRFPMLAIAEISAVPVERARNTAGIPVLPWRTTLGFTVLGAGLIQEDTPQNIAEQLWQDIVTAVTLDPLIDDTKAITPTDGLFDEVEIGATVVTVRQSYSTEIIMNYGHVPTT